MPDGLAQSTPARPLRHISSWKVLGVFCLVVFLFMSGVVFIPWDVTPPDNADLQVKIPVIAPDENAFTWFGKATSVSAFTDPLDGNQRDWHKLTSDEWKGPMIWDPDLAAEVLKANTMVFPLLEKGLACQHYVSPPMESISMRLPWLRKERVGVELLLLKSKQAQVAGDYAESTQRAIQAFGMGKMIAYDCNNVIEWLVGWACQIMVLARFEELIADAQIPVPALQEIQACLEQRDHGKMLDGYKNAMRGDYAAMVQTLKELKTSKGDANLCEEKERTMICCCPYLFKLNATSREFAVFFRHQIKNADLPISRVTAYDETTGVQRLGYVGWFNGRLARLAKPNDFGLVVFWRQTPGYQNTLGKERYCQTVIWALRLKLALRFYELKHGTLPDDLQTLVPEYIREIPNDPYDYAASQPYRYSKSEKKLWSVGYDGKDNGGIMKDDAPMRTVKGYDLVIQVGTRDLKPNLAMPPPSTSTSGAKLR
jgi:hypothetical protein